MKKIKEYTLITFGVLILAFATRLFLSPHNIAGGGVLGIAIVVKSVFFNNVSFVTLGLLMLIMNVFLFIIAFIVIGGRFGAKTIYSSVSLAGAIWILEKVIEPSYVLTNNLMLATIFGTLLSGVGMGIVFNQNASTGGTDILAKIVNKFFHFDIGKSLLMVDFLVTVSAGIAFGADIGMYSLLSVMINGFVIDSVIEGLNMCKEVLVISPKNEQISEYVINELGRGCTIFEGKGGYSGKKTNILYTVLNRREFIKLREHIKEVDSRAFITVSETREVLGEGFKDILS